MYASVSCSKRAVLRTIRQVAEHDDTVVETGNAAMFERLPSGCSTSNRAPTSVRVPPAE